MERTVGGTGLPAAGGGRAPARPDVWIPESGPVVRTVTVRLDRRSLRGWHIRLLDQIGQRPDRRIRIAWNTDGGGLPPSRARTCRNGTSSMH